MMTDEEELAYLKSKSGSIRGMSIVCIITLVTTLIITPKGYTVITYNLIMGICFLILLAFLLTLMLIDTQMQNRINFLSAKIFGKLEERQRIEEKKP